jgi:hypothetical protein
VGKDNKARRAAKKRREQRRDSGWNSAGERRYHHAHYGGGGTRGTGPDLRYLLVAGATVLGHGRASDPDGEVWEPLLAAAGRRGSGATALVVDDVFGECLEGIWEGGWLPAEVVREVCRRRGSSHGDLACTAVAAAQTRLPGSPPEFWTAQLEDLGATGRWWGDGRDWLGPWALRNGREWTVALEMAVETLAVLMAMPVTEVLVPRPSEWRFTRATSSRSTAHVDESVLMKVRALLAKAESTNFEHEADALTAKAQQLMARHAIDEAVANGSAGADREAPHARRVPVDDPYAKAKSSLLGVVASANNVRAVWDDRFALMTLVGFDTDLEAVDVIFTSLVMQASKSMLAKGQVRDTRGRSRTRSYRQSFYIAFAQRIYERLQAAAVSARVDAERDLGRDLLPVLAGRRDEVDDATSKLFPHLTRAKRCSVTNREGWIAGRAAAEMATLGPVQGRLDVSAG